MKTEEMPVDLLNKDHFEKCRKLAETGMNYRQIVHCLATEGIDVHGNSLATKASSLSRFLLENGYRRKARSTNDDKMTARSEILLDNIVGVAGSKHMHPKMRVQIIKDLIKAHDD